jgi:hypothetical protein
MQATGPLYKGKPGLCLERWLFWKSRFSRVTDEVDEEVAEMAQQAVGEMERAEKVMKKHAMDLYTDSHSTAGTASRLSPCYLADEIKCPERTRENGAGQKYFA